MKIQLKAKKLVNEIFNSLGYKILSKDTFNYKFDLTDQETKILNYVLENKLTMGSKDNLAATILAARYISKNKIKGDFVECGVWRGGHGIAAALTFKLYSYNSKIICFDTFSGMTKPDEHDSELYSMQPANMLLNRESNKVGKWTTWANASLEDVQFGLSKCCIQKEQVKFVVGDVHNTVPSNLSESISVCRIDTDWYSSTRHILENCWDRISPGGILILDDYDIWSGARKAVDEFFLSIEYKPFLIRTEIGRVVVK